MIVVGYSGFTRDSRAAGSTRSAFARPGMGFDALFAWRDGEAPFHRFPLGFFGHDAAAALVRDGKVVAAASEERFTRVKHSLNLAGNTLLPSRALRYCLDAAGIEVADVDLFAHYSDFGAGAVEDRRCLLAPFLADDEPERLARAYGDVHRAMLSPDAVALQLRALTGREDCRLLRVPHHLAHAASAFYPSGFDRALVLTLDGSGERESSVLAIGEGRRITPIARTPLPDSLGALYLLVTVHLGFRSLGDEYKVMGLASEGDPARYRSFFDKVVTLGPRGTYRTSALAASDFRERMLEGLGPARAPGEEIGGRHADIAASLQEALARAVLHTLRHARATTGLCRLCLSGGVALNCTMNGAVARSGLFDDVFVQPAAGDEGGSLGAALQATAANDDGVGAFDPLRDVFLGPSYSEAEVLAALQPHAGVLSWHRSDDIAVAAAAQIERHGVIAWFRGRMEFGPRALGHRSILADPRDAGMKDRLNLLVKHREPFRPFAPAVAEEVAGEWFDMTGLARSPFMLFTVPVQESRRPRIPAVTHTDGSARVQTVSRETNPEFWRLIDAFGRRTGVPVVLNTSFNVNREPIVASPEDAVRCFFGTRIPVLAIGEFLVGKTGTG